MNFNTSFLRIGRLLQSSHFTYCKRSRFLNTLRQSVIFELESDVDVNKIKQTYASGRFRPRPIASIVKEELEERYSNFINSFDESLAKLWKVVRLEQNFLYSEGYDIPPTEALTNRHWLEAMTLSTMEERLLYYLSLRRLFDSRKRVETRMGESSKQSTEDGENKYSIFLDFLPDSSQERLENHRLAAAMLFGEPLLIDMGFEESNLLTELEPLASQLWNMYLTNRSSSKPFHLIFINCSQSSPIFRFLSLHYMISADEIMATFTTESHSNMFQRHDCVYMSSQSKESLTEFDPNKVYILGAYHDPLVRKKHSLAKARHDGVRCFRVPIDEHVRWAHQAHKDLDMDRILQVLLCVKHGMNWKDAFFYSVPSLVKDKS